jgi:signal transduction histidine kinase
VTRSRIFLGLGSLAALVFAALFMAAWPLDTIDLSIAMQGALAVYLASVAIFAGIRFAESRDPRALFAATGLGIVAFQTAAFCVVWQVLAPLRVVGSGALGPGAFGVAAPNSGAVPPLAWQGGWAIAGILFVLAVPWRERRGRPPVHTPTVIAAAVVAAAAIDLVLIVWRPSMSSSTFRQILAHDVPTAGLLGPISWLFAAIAVAMLVVAAFREGLAWRGRRSAHPWLAAAFLLLVSIQIAVLVRPTEGTPLVQWADAFQPVAIGLIFVSLVLSQRRETSRLRRASDRAVKIVEGRAEIASMVAHEVRGPVTTIRGIAATAATHYDGLSDGERREFFDLIEQESRRLLGAVDQTSLALKVDAGSLTYQMAQTELAPIVRAGVDSAAVASDAHALHVVAQEDVTLVADRSRLAEVVRQLVDNAAKFSPHGTPIIVRAVADEDSAFIEVTDEGPGIPADQRAEVFTRFTRWRPSGYEEQPGNGLGLFICRGLAAEHQGEISVEDGPGGGTMLRVRLPLGGT